MPWVVRGREVRGRSVARTPFAAEEAETPGGGRFYRIAQLRGGGPGLRPRWWALGLKGTAPGVTFRSASDFQVRDLEDPAGWGRKGGEKAQPAPHPSVQLASPGRGLSGRFSNFLLGCFLGREGP